MRRLLPFATLLLLAACDPRAGYNDLFMGPVAITARVLSPRPVIHLGDSVAFYFEVPDSVTLNGTRLAVSVGAKDEANLDVNANKINAAASTGFDIYSRNCQLYAAPGSVTAYGSLRFAHRNAKLVSKLYLIPKQRGIYFFEQAGPGLATLNGRDLQVTFTFDFGSVNRNHQLLIDSAGTASKFSTYLQRRISQGHEIYGFRVI